jgi:hypothetical protein
MPSNCLLSCVDPLKPANKLTTDLDSVGVYFHMLYRNLENMACRTDKHDSPSLPSGGVQQLVEESELDVLRSRPQGPAIAQPRVGVSESETARS